MAGIARRGGRGSNQYSVKPPTVKEEDAALRGIHSLRDAAIPNREYGRVAENGIDDKLVSIINRIEGGDDSAINELYANYPETYSRAIIDNPDVRAEAKDELEADTDELADMLVCSDDEPQAKQTANITSLIVTSARDYDNRHNNLEEIQEQITLRNRAAINSISF